VCLGASFLGVLPRGLPPLAGVSASRLRISPTAEVYMRVKSVSILRAMHCTRTACSSTLRPCRGRGEENKGG
jgi:hypothetical protein